MRPRWVQRHQVQVRSQCEPQSPDQVRLCLASDSPVTGEAHVEPESPGTEEAKVRTRVIWIRTFPVGNRVTISDDAQVEPETPGPDEAQVGSIFTRSR